MNKIFVRISQQEREHLIEVCKAFCERPANKNSILVVKTKEVRERLINTGSGVQTFLLPEQDADPKVRASHVHCGCVIGIMEPHETEIKKGDLIRYSPGSAEEITSSDGMLTYYPITQYDIRTVSHSVFSEEEGFFPLADNDPTEMLAN